MKNKKMIFVASFLIIAIGNYFRISNGEVRAVDFLSIFAIGMLVGVLLTQIFKKNLTQE
ncbi:MAG: hypothetical protein ACKVOQ_09315 [Cyclobacteriaceae bacterium]